MRPINISPECESWKRLRSNLKALPKAGVLGPDGAGTPIGLIMVYFLDMVQGDIKMETMANEITSTHLPTYKKL